MGLGKRRPRLPSPQGFTRTCRCRWLCGSGLSLLCGALAASASLSACLAGPPPFPLVKASCHPPAAPAPSGSAGTVQPAACHCPVRRSHHLTSPLSSPPGKEISGSHLLSRKLLRIAQLRPYVPLSPGGASLRTFPRSHPKLPRGTSAVGCAGPGGASPESAKGNGSQCSPRPRETAASWWGWREGSWGSLSKSLISPFPREWGVGSCPRQSQLLGLCS